MTIPTKDFIRLNKKFVKMKDTQYNDVFVLKYSPKVFYKYLWEGTYEECRGTLVNSNLDIVSRPYTKIFNHNEPHAPKFDDDEVCLVSDKINGFMCAVTWHDGVLIVSTTGTTDSDFAKVARKEVMKVTNEAMFKDYKDYTFIFEVCTKEDKHIIDEDYGVYLLDARKKEWDTPNIGLGSANLNVFRLQTKYRNPDNFNESFKRPKQWMYRYKDAMSIVKDYKREGFVVTSLDLKRQVKMKSPFYLTSKWLAKLNNDNIERLLSNPQACKAKIDEEFFPIVDYLNYHLDYYKTLSNFDKAMFVQEFFNEG